MPDYKLRIIAEGKDRASGPLGRVSSALGGLATVAGGILAAGLLYKIGQGIVDIGKFSIQSAADAEEMLSKLNVTFGEATEGLQTNLNEFAGAAGRSRFELQGMAADMGAVLKAMGFQDQRASELSQSMTELAVDVGSFMNLQDADVLNRFQRALTGEFESLKALGVVINQNVIDQQLQAQGYEESWQELDQLTKAEIVHGILLEQTADAQGDAIRTSGSFTNQMRRLKGQLKDTATEIGTALLPAGTSLLNVFNDLWTSVGPQVTSFIENDLVPGIEALVGLFLDLLQGGGPDLGGLFPPELIAGVDRVRQGATELFLAFQEHLPLALEKGRELTAWAQENLVPVLGGALTTVGELLSQFAGWWSENGDKVIATVTVMAQFVGATIGGLMTLVTGLVRVGLAILRGDWDGAWQAVKDTVERFMNLALSIVGQNLDQFVSTWRTNIEMAKLIIKTGLDRAVALVTNVIGRFRKAGQSLIQGLINGIMGKIGDLKARLQRALEDVLDLVNRIFSIGSPSKVFEEIGGQLMAGLAKGVDTGAATAAGAVTAASNMIIGGAGGGGRGGGTVVYLTVEGAGDPREVARAVARELRLQGVNI